MAEFDRICEAHINRIEAKSPNNKEIEHDYGTGELFVEKKSMKVAVKNGYINLLELQLPGKRKMHINEVLNGLNLEKEAHLR